VHPPSEKRLEIDASGLILIHGVKSAFAFLGSDGAVQPSGEADELAQRETPISIEIVSIKYGLQPGFILGVGEIVGDPWT
jgi:hypothetical protein